MAQEGDQLMTAAQAYEAAYRFAWRYAKRDPQSESLQLMLVAMEPTSDNYRTNDPASWDDWWRCVEETLHGETVPRFPRMNGE